MAIDPIVNRIAGEFEAAWQAGQSPRIADFLQRISAEHAAELIRVLVPLDVKYQRQRGIVVSAHDYADLGNEAVAVALGCQFQSHKSASGGVVLQASVTYQPDPWEKFFRLRRAGKHTAILLGPEHFWVDTGSWIESWPLDAMHKLCGDGLLLKFYLEANQREYVDCIKFATMEEREVWQEAISARIHSQVPLVANDWTPERVIPVLLKSRQNLRCQVLGSVEVTSDSENTARASLRLLAATQDADAIFDVSVEQIPPFSRSQWRACGTAIRSLDREGKIELATQRFSEHVSGSARRATILFTVLFIANLMLLAIAININNTSAIHVTSAELWSFVGVRIFFYFWPILVSLWLWRSRTPQLARATALSLLGFVSFDVVAFAVYSYAIVFSDAHGELSDNVQNLPSLLFYFLIVGSIHVAILSNVILLSRKMSLEIRTLRDALCHAPVAVSCTRKWVGRLAYSTSCVYLAGMVCIGALAGYVWGHPLSSLKSFIAPKAVQGTLATGDKKASKRGSDGLKKSQ